jgi:hypothetical protein
MRVYMSYSQSRARGSQRRRKLAALSAHALFSRAFLLQRKSELIILKFCLLMPAKCILQYFPQNLSSCKMFVTLIMFLPTCRLWACLDGSLEYLPDKKYCLEVA